MGSYVLTLLYTICRNNIVVLTRSFYRSHRAALKHYSRSSLLRLLFQVSVNPALRLRLKSKNQLKRSTFIGRHAKNKLDCVVGLDDSGRYGVVSRARAISETNYELSFSSWKPFSVYRSEFVRTPRNNTSTKRLVLLLLLYGEVRTISSTEKGKTRLGLFIRNPAEAFSVINLRSLAFA